MMLSSLRRWSFVTPVALSALVACAGQPTPPPAPLPPAVEVPIVPIAQAEPPPNDAPRIAVEDEDPGADPGPIPVTREDPQWGSRSAPVTIVVFSDLQCPFCARLHGTLDLLKREYGPGQLRIVWKNYPLSFHKDARAAAEAGMALFQRGGSEWFWNYESELFNDQRAFDYSGIAQRVGRVDANTLGALMAQGSVAQKVDGDMALAKKVGVTGTPASFINGVFLSGAQPAEKFKEIIDQELVKAKALLGRGVAPTRVYAAAAAQNYAEPKPAPTTTTPAPDDTTPWKVPVAGAPVRGKASAPVTLVMFADYQCPFCQRVEDTVTQLSSEYGDKLRVVWKDNPLPFHPRAEPAAELALEARAQKGDAAFWKAHDLLMAQKGQLDDQALEGVAKAVGLNVTAAMAAVQSKKHAAKIEADQDLADDVQASGTPHFFINGRRLVGAQPIEKFRAVIDEQLQAAQALVKKGTAAAKVYDELQKTAKTAPPPETRKVAPPTQDNPSRGPARAKVVVQVFGDYQCPFCKRLAPTIDELEKAFPGKLRIVWRNRPLAFHKEAEPAAEAAMEAFRQKGADGFWKMSALLFEAQGVPGGLERPGLEQIAAQAGLDLAKFKVALDTRAHRAVIEADSKVADDAGISGTPGTMINGYFVSGAQPLAKFKKVVARALAEAK